MDVLFQNVCTNEKFLYSAFYSFDNTQVCDLIEQAGCPLKTERGDRVFPVSDHSSDVIAALQRELHKYHVDIHLHTEVKKILTKESDDNICFYGVECTDHKKLTADACIICTGGCSYAATGSTGDGYRFAEETGHKVTERRPALVPLEIRESWCKALMGLSLKNVEIRMQCGKKTWYEGFGEMLFTHFGVSGPIILSLSRQAAQLLEAGSFLELEIDLKPALSLEQLDARLLRDFEKYQRKEIKNGMKDLLPGRLIEPVLDAAYLEPERMVNTVTREERHRLAQVLKGLSMVISGTRPIAEAIVTAGGVDVKEINPKTMESKLVKGLYFAGEVADVDGYTGGFNLQAAFSMGAAAGCWSVWNS